MSYQKYEDVEKQFLEAMAIRYGFTGKTKLVFEKRFREKDHALNDKDLAEQWERDLLEGTKKGNDPAIILRDRLKEICKKLETKGCNFNGATKGKWKIAKQWLREDVFPKWVQGPPSPLTLEQLWQQLVDRARPTNLMGPVIADNLDMWSPYQDCMRLGSNIRFEFNLGHAGHLLLLEKATSGKVLCLCPSFLAPRPYLPDGNTVLPQEGARLQSLKVTGTIGLEQIVAVMGENLPPLNWIPQPDQQPLQLQKDHLDDLLQYLEGRLDYQVLYAEFTVTAV